MKDEDFTQEELKLESEQEEQSSQNILGQKKGKTLLERLRAMPYNKPTEEQKNQIFIIPSSYRSRTTKSS